MSVKDIMNLSQNMNALAVASHNIKLANKKKTTTKDFIKAGSTNLVGTSLLKANDSLIGEL